MTPEFNAWCQERHIKPELAIMDYNMMTQWIQRLIEQRVTPHYANQYAEMSQLDRLTKQQRETQQRIQDEQERRVRDAMGKL